MGGELRRALETAAAESGCSLSDLTVLRELNDALRIDVDPDDLPPIELPEAEIGGVASYPPLIDSRWDFAAQCRALIDSKAYRANGGP